jgi:gamma-glutamyltranspeptidase/glutathione hydrolase
LGFLYNGDVGHYNPRAGQSNSIEGGRKTNLGGSTLAVFRGNEPYVVIGAPGGTRIVTSIVQSLLNVIEFGMDMRTAVTMPRFHSQDRQRIFVEPTIADGVVEGLERSGYDVIRSRYQARPQAIRFLSGRLDGGGDPRGQTSADISEYPPFDPATDPSES